MGDTEKLVALLQKSAAIGFVAMEDEPDYRNFLSAHGIAHPVSVVPPEKELVPHELAEKFKMQHQEDVVVLVPGRKFDKTGTRHGRGMGWYDRFLAETPKHWIRVGVLSPDLLHETLARKSWDEPVDYLLIVSGDESQVIETHARF